MHEVALIGGLSSSGSTLLMHLLSRENGFLCLPETGLFAHGQYLLDYGGIDPKCVDVRLSLPWLDTRAKLQEALGMEHEAVDEIFAAYRNSFAFAQDRFSIPGCLLVEKTPANVFAFDVYLARYPEARVVVTSRDCLGVVQSLMRRGVSMHDAYLIWFGHAYAVCELMRKYPNQVFHCPYSLLTSEPETILAAVIAHLRYGREVGNGDCGESVYGGPVMGRMVEFSSRELEATAWNFSVRDRVRFREPINYLGNRFEVMFRRVAFEIAPGQYVRGRSVEEGLGSKRPNVKSFFDEQLPPIPHVPGSLLTRTLLSMHAMCASGG